MNASLECTRLRQKHKSGPKGIRKRTIDRLEKLKHQEAPLRPLRPEDLRSLSASSTSFEGRPSQFPQDNRFDQDILSATPITFDTFTTDHLVQADFNTSPPVQPPVYPYRISLEHLTLYLDIYHHKLYPVWPIVNRDDLVARLHVFADYESYVLASSICVATILQLQLSATDPSGATLQPESVIEEIESLRRANDYQEHLSSDALCTSFFLHVAYLHIKKQHTSTLTLREAISVAHLLELHKPSHYEGLSEEEASNELRKIWLLYITERAHALQYDLPCTLTLPQNLSTPSADAEPYTLSAFVSLCDMFKALSEASTDTGQTATALSLVHNKLLQLPTPIQPYNQLQKADVGVTQHWMRLHLWKLAVSRIKMSTDPAEDITSLLFPLRLAHDLLSEVSTITVDSLEAHGSGMELKLFDFVNAVADVMVCMPQCWTDATHIGPREYLIHLGKVLGGFRGGNEALLPLMQSRFTELGLALPAIPRLIDVTNESSDSSMARVTYLGDEVTHQSEEEYVPPDDWSRTRLPQPAV